MSMHNSKWEISHNMLATQSTFAGSSKIFNTYGYNYIQFENLIVALFSPFCWNVWHNIWTLWGINKKLQPSPDCVMEPALIIEILITRLTEMLLCWENPLFNLSQLNLYIHYIADYIYALCKYVNALLGICLTTKAKVHCGSAH